MPIKSRSGRPKIAEEEVEVRPADDHRLATHRLGDHRPRGPPEDREAQRDEQQVVVEKRRLARDERLELRVVRSCGSRSQIIATANTTAT